MAVSPLPLTKVIAVQNPTTTTTPSPQLKGHLAIANFQPEVSTNFTTSNNIKKVWGTISPATAARSWHQY